MARRTAIGIGGLLAAVLVIVVVAVATSPGDEPPQQPEPPAAAAPPTPAPAPPTPEPKPQPTPTPAPPPIFDPETAPEAPPLLDPQAAPAPPPPAPEPGEPVAFEGRGPTGTNPVPLPFPLSVVRLTHDGDLNFIVEAHVGERFELLVNEIGAYQGERPLAAGDPVVFHIDADGRWAIEISPIEFEDSPPFEGQGDSVSGLFDPPPPGAWQIEHEGEMNFVVIAHCDGGWALLQNEIGPVSTSSVVSFPGRPCFWEVQADGNFSLTPG